ncbi:MAG: branched-chain amino acid ABC transporter ATP-binding protein/permease [Hyphomicrobiaceae bacterium]
MSAEFWVGTEARSSALLLALIVGLGTLILHYVFGVWGDRIATLLLMSLMGVLALSVFTGNSGIVSFGHTAFMGIGAYVSGILTMPAAVQKGALPSLPDFLAGHELGLAPALAFVLLAGLVAGLVTGLPIARLSGSGASIATLALLIIIHVILVGAREITRGSQTFYGVPNLTTVWVALPLALAFIVVARLFKDMPAGLRLRAARENEVAAAASGVNIFTARYVGWVLSAALAAVAGAIYGHFLSAFSPKDFYFDLMFTMIAMLIVGGMLTVTGAIVGTALITAVIQILRQVESGFDLGFVHIPIIFGLTLVGLGLALLLAIWRRPLGVAGLYELAWPASAGPTAELAAAPPAPPAQGAALEIAGLTKRFGGLVAAEDVSFRVAPGEIVGLIGPNGAGKTTIVNMICGQLQPDAGDAVLDGASLAGQGPSAIARLGLGRTFQAIRLFDRLTVTENIMVAALSVEESPGSARQAVARLLTRLELRSVADQRAGTLAYGPRRRLEIARALALRPRYLLLDEPAAGMNPAETDALVATLSRIRDDFGVGLLVIEHDMRLIMRLCDRIVVVNKGQKIAEGTPEAVRGDEKVIEAYIGRRRERAAA